MSLKEDIEKEDPKKTEQKEEENEEEENSESVPGTAMTFGTAGIGTESVYSSVGESVRLMGFGSTISSGSMAASMMNAAATSGYGGAIVSALQRAGALFVNVVGSSVFVATTALVASITVGVGAVTLYKHMNKKKTNQQGKKGVTSTKDESSGSSKNQESHDDSDSDSDDSDDSDDNNPNRM